jgi:hypothetical protein
MLNIILKNTYNITKLYIFLKSDSILGIPSQSPIMEPVNYCSDALAKSCFAAAGLRKLAGCSRTDLPAGHYFRFSTLGKRLKPPAAWGGRWLGKGKESESPLIEGLLTGNLTSSG